MRKDGWVENPSEEGYEFYGWIDELCSNINHTGWFCSEYEDEVARGCIFLDKDGDYIPAFRVGILKKEWKDSCGSKTQPALMFFNSCTKHFIVALRYAETEAKKYAETCRAEHEAYNAGREVKEKEEENDRLKKDLIIMRAWGVSKETTQMILARITINEGKIGELKDGITKETQGMFDDGYKSY